MLLECSQCVVMALVAGRQGCDRPPLLRRHEGGQTKVSPIPHTPHTDALVCSEEGAPQPSCQQHTAANSYTHPHIYHRYSLALGRRWMPDWLPVPGWMLIFLCVCTGGFAAPHFLDYRLPPEAEGCRPPSLTRKVPSRWCVVADARIGEM